MKTYYSILKISGNATLGDSISVGVILFGDNGVYFNYSENKVNTCEKLFNFPKGNLIKQIQALKKSVDVTFENSSEGSFDFPQRIISPESFLSYLNQYSKGAIQFSKHRSIIIKKSFDYDTFFENLLAVSFKKEKNVSEKHYKYESVIREKLLTPLEGTVHTNINIDQSDYSGMFFKIHLDLLGENGSLVAAKSIDFESKADAIRKSLSYYDSAISIISRYRNTAAGKIYVIAEEPNYESTGKQSVLIWDSINSPNSMFEIVHPEQSEMIYDYVVSSKASKFLLES